MLHVKFGLLSLGKASSHSTALPSVFVCAFFSPLCSVFVSIPPAARAYYFTTDEYGIFNMRTYLGACRTQEGGVRYKEVCTRVDSEGQKNFLTLPRQGTEPRVFGFEFRGCIH